MTSCHPKFNGQLSHHYLRELYIYDHLKLEDHETDGWMKPQSEYVADDEKQVHLIDEEQYEQAKRNPDHTLPRELYIV